MSTKWICASVFVVGIVMTAVSHGCGGGTSVSPREPSAHRAKAPSCVFQRGLEPEDPQNGSCRKHADCVARPNGACVNVAAGPGYARTPYYECVYTLCAADSECAANEVCQCSDGLPGACVGPGNCRVDADCGGGANSYCSRAYGSDCGGYHPLGSYFCHTPKDTCVDDSDCSGDEYCNYDIIEGWWECMAPDLSCAIG